MSNECPDPAVGQVWEWYGDWDVFFRRYRLDKSEILPPISSRLVSKGTQAMITHISPSLERHPKPLKPLVHMGVNQHVGAHWPPENARLVSGPSAPWPSTLTPRSAWDLVADLQSRIDNNDTRIAPNKVLRLFEEAIAALNFGGGDRNEADLALRLILDLTRQLVDSASFYRDGQIQVDPETFRDLRAALSDYGGKT
jgi:hypothetical protein